MRDSLRTWSPFPLSASHLRFQVREKSRTSEPTPRAGPLSGHPTLPGARFPSHLESVPAVGQSLALPGAREKSHLGAPPRVPVLRVAFPFFQVRDSPSHLESVPAVGQSLALPGAREESHLEAPPRVLAL